MTSDMHRKSSDGVPHTNTCHDSHKYCMDPVRLCAILHFCHSIACKKIISRKYFQKVSIAAWKLNSGYSSSERKREKRGENKFHTNYINVLLMTAFYRKYFF